MIARRKRLKPGGWIKRRKRVRPRNPKRHAENQQRAYEGPRAEFVKLLPCLVCGWFPSENAHVTNGGMSRKDDACRTVPLCGDFANGHHTEYDGGKRSFVAKYAVQLAGRTMLEWAERVEAAWQQWQREHSAGLTPIAEVVPGVVASILERAEDQA